MRNTALVLVCLLTTLGSEATRADPRADYLLHCAGCHRPSGAGLPPDVPTLVGELGRLVEIPEGREYLVRVPGASQAPVSDQRLAAIINWILREFNAETLPDGFVPFSAAEVSRGRGNTLADPMKFRRKFWGDYDDANYDDGD